jgi:hypothetical protein
MSSACRECRDGLDHCHGTVVHHIRFGVECTDDCATPDAVHAFSIDCDAVGCTCAVTVGVESFEGISATG